MLQEHLNIVNTQIYAYLLIDLNLAEILDGNKLARTFYKEDSHYPSIHQLFHEPLDTLLEHMTCDSAVHNNITSFKADGTSFSCHVEFYKLSATLLFAVIKEICQEKDAKMSELIELYDNPFFCLEADPDFTISYGNTRYSPTFPTGTLDPNSSKQLSFIQQLPEEKRLAFSQTVQHQLDCDGECDVDLELNFGTDYFQLFRFNAFKSIFDGKLYGVLISAKKQSELMKKIEYDQQYFDIMQKFSKDLLFRIDIKKRTLVHRGDISKFVDLLPELDNFPECMRENRLVHPDDLEGFIAFSYRLMSGFEASFEPRFQFNNGTFEKYRLQGSPLFDTEGNAIQVVGKSENIQKYVEIEAKAHYDSLTTTLNKQSFKELVENCMERAVVSDRFALLFIDLDNFKQVNDQMGHMFGDFLLEATGKRILNCVRSQDRVGRVGGDEFVIFFQFAPNDEAVLERAEAVLHSLRREFTYGTQRYKARASIGISIFPDHGTDYDSLYLCADKALYQSKARGKDVATVYDKTLE